MIVLAPLIGYFVSDHWILNYAFNYKYKWDEDIIISQLLHPFCSFHVPGGFPYGLSTWIEENFQINVTLACCDFNFNVHPVYVPRH